MAIFASSAITILDTTDQNQLSAYLTSNLPTVQTCTSNGAVYTPSWSATPLEITLHAFWGQSEINDFSKYTITWHVQDGTNDKTQIISNANKKTLKITTNDLSLSQSGMLTYWCRIALDEVNFIETRMSYTLLTEATAVTFYVHTPNGNTFQNQEGQLVLATEKYCGVNKITSGATFKWYKYENTDWQSISGAQSDSLTVSGSDVLNIASYKCIMTYQGVEYIGVATLQDKSDLYVSEIYTVGGNIFKNGVGGCAAYVIVRSNGKEVDPLLGPVSATAPSNPQPGDFWYKIDNSSKKIIQQRRKSDGTKWYTMNDTTEYKEIPQELNYTWTLIDQNGNDIAFSNESETKTGKVIYISCADIHDIGTVQCDVSTKE